MERKSEPWLTVRSEAGPLPKPEQPRRNTGARLEVPCVRRTEDAGTLAATPWTEFRRQYEAAASPVFAPATFALWRSAAKLFELVIEPTTIGEVTPELLDLFEGYMVRKRYSHHRIVCNLSRVRHAVIWACDAGYLDSLTFAILPVGNRVRWTGKYRSTQRRSA